MATKKNDAEVGALDWESSLEETKSLLGLASADARLALERSKQANEKVDKFTADLKNSLTKLEKNQEEVKSLREHFDDLSKKFR
jgi:flagellar hook-basal body complex protein FliE